MNNQKLTEYLKKSELMYLATCFNDKPHVRCMAMIYFEDTIWCCSKLNRLKVAEIKQNNAIEICILVEGENDLGSIRGNGKAIIISNSKVRQKLSKNIPFFSSYWETPDDDDFILIKLEIDTFMFHDPDDKQFYSIPA
jgi:uncharacterized pyridoxamine 5'-phosphate oxidase family protein